MNSILSVTVKLHRGKWYRNLRCGLSSMPQENKNSAKTAGQALEPHLLHIRTFFSPPVHLTEFPFVKHIQICIRLCWIVRFHGNSFDLPVFQLWHWADVTLGSDFLNNLGRKILQDDAELHLNFAPIVAVYCANSKEYYHWFIYSLILL